MEFREKQRAVFASMVVASMVSVFVILVGISCNPFGCIENASTSERVMILAASCMAIGLCFAIHIGIMARHRFFSTEDIDGGGLRVGSDQAHILQAVLQNTLEQSVLAIITYLAWAVLMPATYLSVIPLAASSFIFGRLLFFLNYKKGAARRALGFALTFYPTVFMLFYTAFVFFKSNVGGV